MEEEWRPVKGYEGLYEVSNMGRVRSLYYGKSRILKQGVDCHGYMHVCLSKDGTCNTKRVHRLVATAFIQNPDNYECVNHKDGNKKNNTVDNLEWCTISYNTKHAYHNGLINTGTRRKKSIILYKRYGEYKSVTEAAETLGVAPRSLSRAIHKNSSIHGFVAVIKKDKYIGCSIPTNIYNDKLVFLEQAPSTNAAARFTKVSATIVRRCCRKKVFSKGYTFRFFDDDEISSKKEE